LLSCRSYCGEANFGFQTQSYRRYFSSMIEKTPVLPVEPDAAITIGEYRATGGPFKENGHWTEVEVREGGVWKIRLLTVASKTRLSAVTAGIETNSPGAGP
jgi:hypothetical protein